MMGKIAIIAASVAMACMVTAGMQGCATPGEKTAVGTAGGAAGGAIIGAAVGGTKGAAYGAGIGAVAGGVIGNQLDRQAQELAKVAETHRTEQGILVRLKNDLLFDTNSDQLKPQAQDQLAQLGQILAKYPKDRIRVDGYTDSVGSAQFNEELSNRRARVVADALRVQGVTENQLLTFGHGESDPVATNKTTQGRAMNRRVELQIDMPNAKQQAGRAEDSRAANKNEQERGSDTVAHPSSSPTPPDGGPAPSEGSASGSR